MNIEPTTIGRYRVLGELGQGAMGIVYLAEDPLLKRGVAIKVMKPGTISADEALKRFHREAEVSAKLNHPNIITIFDVGEEPGVGPFLAMEHLQGTNLTQWLRGTPRDIPSILRLLIQGMHALESAHAEGITHRDIKPDNLMVTHNGRLKLMDFGIARAENDHFVTTAALLCTPGYTAPELLDGKSSNEATDRWAFVVTTYQSLTGMLPWEADTLAGILYNVAHSPPKFPDSMDPKVQAVFEWALAKNPDMRHPTLQAFMRELIDAAPMAPEQRAQLQALVGYSEDSGSISVQGTGAIATSNATSDATSTATSNATPVATSNATPERSYARQYILYGVLAAVLLLATGQWVWMSGLFRGRVLTLYSKPEGAKVFVDGSFLGLTPLENIKVAAKVTKLKVEKEGFLPYEHPLEPGDTGLRFNLTPEPIIHVVKTEPSGAEIFLDGVLKGITPMGRLAVAAEGSHNLYVRKKGYQPWSQNLRPGAAIPEMIKLQLLVEERVQPPSPPRSDRAKTRKPVWKGEDPNQTKRSTRHKAKASGTAKEPDQVEESKADETVKAEEPSKFKTFFRKLFRRDKKTEKPKPEPTPE